MHDYDHLVREQSVLCGFCALARAGLTTFNNTILALWQDQVPRYDGINFGVVVYYYKEDIDYEHYLRADSDNPHILIPTKERAIVEYILNEKWCDEGMLVEALKNYLLVDPAYNMDLLLEVADFFGLDSKTLDYWIDEAINDKEI